uniref:Receptor-like serine/threonine-protein kinase n=1 Tax=Cajanus cajan TaxID=3821 RepID=A0A151QRL6_CAJCA|nr:putative LRR receptor-like serine/threonine-protein kinase At5g45780 family [Cajanus cajan]
MALPLTLTLLIPTLIYLHHLPLAFANVALNSSLSTNDKDAWRSPSGEFAFGFRQLNNDTKLFMLAIWYPMIPEETVVWSAKAGDTLATAPTGSRVQITSQGLSLTTPQGDSLWTSNSDVVVSEGAMLDTGNFVLLNGNSFDYVWESFQNPTDTLLPNQSLKLDANLNSRLTDTNYSSGRFQLYFQDGNVLLSPLAWPSQLRYNSYYVINASGAASSFDFDTSGDIHVKTQNGTRIQPQGPTWGNITLDPKGYYYRATLDVSGVFTQYSHPRNTSNSAQQGWTIMRYVPGNICNAIFNEYGSGSCGYNSYCSMQNQNQRPTCKCPYGYSLVDPSNEFGGCQPNVTLACGADVQKPPEELYEMHEARNFNFPLGDYEKIQPYTKEKCWQSCLHDCILLLATVVLFILLKQKMKRVVPGASTLLETNLHWFSYEALKEATWGFSEELGRGSCAIVYKGKLKAPSCNVVAVKRLDRLAQEREKEFRTELSSIGKTSHKNLVRLIGFCDEGMNRILVYEFMSNGTLADVLFGQSKPVWNLRVRFALGIARGLVYLHEECDTPIIHCDIKPQNILIDEHFNAKISDFGLSKLLLSDQSRTNTMIRGTRGYVAPEWFKNVAVTVKVDVYSFGVMLLEIICCRRSVLKMETEEEENAILTDWAYDCYLEGRIDAMVEDDDEALCDNGRLQKWVKIAICCINEQPELRPTMGMVMQMLEGFVEVPNP